MAGATVAVSGPGPSSVVSTARSAAVLADPAPGLATPVVLPAGGVAPEVMAQLGVVLGAAGVGGLSGVSSDQALQVVEAVEVVKAWADAVSIAATAVLVTELESDFSLIAKEALTARGWRLFFRSCRSAAAREIQVATGLPITQCQRRVWLSACEPERVGGVREAMRAGRVSLARAMSWLRPPGIWTRSLRQRSRPGSCGRLPAPMVSPCRGPRRCRRPRSRPGCASSWCCTTGWSAKPSAPMPSRSRAGVWASSRSATAPR